MSLQPEELLLRSVLQGDRPVTVPGGLAARLDRIPDEVSPLRPLPVRLVLGIAPWAAVAAAGLALAFGPAWALGRPAATGGTAPFAWSAEDPGGGFAEVGPLGISWVLPVAYLAVASFAWAIRRVRRGEDLRPAFSTSSLRRALTRKPRTLGEYLVYVGFILVIFGVPLLTTLRDPIQYGSVFGPGPQVDVVTGEGQWYDEASGDADPYPRAPNYVYRVSPGDAFSVILSVRNVWPVPITVLGLPRPAGKTTTDFLEGNDAAWNGLGLLRDPAVVSALPKDVVPFHPVSLLPGQEVTLVLAYLAGECADPAADVPADDALLHNPAIALVYDAFGWRGTGHTNPQFALTVPVRTGCMAGS